MIKIDLRPRTQEGISHASRAKLGTGTLVTAVTARSNCGAALETRDR